MSITTYISYLFSGNLSGGTRKLGGDGQRGSRTDVSAGPGSAHVRDQLYATRGAKPHRRAALQRAGRAGQSVYVQGEDIIRAHLSVGL